MIAPSSDLVPEVGRRTLVSRIGGMLGALGIATFGRNVVQAGPFRPQSPTTSGKHPNLPRPTYVPAGFKLLRSQWGPPEGFGGGDNELSLIFSKGGMDPVTLRNYPLKVIITTEVRRAFGTTRDAKAMPCKVYMDSGLTVPGDYFDGWWLADPNGEVVVWDGERVHWDTTDVHSLVFEYSGFHVGINGSRRKGVTFEELMRIAASVR